MSPVFGFLIKFNLIFPNLFSYFTGWKIDARRKEEKNEKINSLYTHQSE